MWLISLFFCFWLIWFVPRQVYRRSLSKGVHVTTEFTDSDIFEGENTSITETVTNEKKLPVPALAVRLGMDKALHFRKGAIENSSVSDQTYRKDIFSLGSRQRIIRTLPLVAKQRGHYTIRQVDLTTYDHFFRRGDFIHCDQDTEIYVYPAPVDAGRITLISSAITGELLSQSRLYPDPFAFAGIRDYRPEDSMRAINWKASARSGSLMVNEFDSTTRYEVTILLDLEDRFSLRQDRLLEECLRIATSLAASLLTQGMPVRILYGKREDSYQHSNELTGLYRTMACLDYNPEGPTVAERLLAETASLENASNRLYVLISKNQQEELADSAKQLKRLSPSLLWVMPVYETAMDERYQDSNLSILYWEV